MAEVASPADSLDWDELRQRSLVEGGFGNDRALLWPQILHAQPSSWNVKPEADIEVNTPAAPVEKPDEPLDEKANGNPLPTDPKEEPHRDERQIRLDTERSFVFYPAGSMQQRHMLQGQLHHLLVTMFRKRRQLSYFQGYHDIITVLFLTLPEDLQLSSTEKLSLHRVRDSMGSGLEPVLGLLRILKNLLQVADPEFAALLEQTSPLPYYALSNLLTLFSHDMPTLALIQHVFDYLLCRPPIAAVYLAAAIILSRKQEVQRLQEEGEEGMLHSLLSGLPDLFDGEETKAESRETKESKQEPTPVKTEVGDVELPSGDVQADGHPEAITVPQSMKDEPTSGISTTSQDEPKSIVVTPPPVFGALTDVDPLVPSLTDDAEQPLQDNLPSNIFEGAESLSPTNTAEIDEEKPLVSTPPTPPPESDSESDAELFASRTKVSLSSLLLRADELYQSYPPSQPSLCLSETMGPQSVVYTWSEDPSNLPSDDEAEAMVLKPELVVYPYVEPEPSENDEHDEKGKRRRRRKLRKPRRFVVGGRAMVAGAVIVLGVSMAVYGIRSGHVQRYSRGHGWRPWRKMEQVGGILAGAGERIIHGLQEL